MPLPFRTASVEKHKGTLSTGAFLAYGSSAVSENLALNHVAQLAFPIFNLALGVSPSLIGIALALPSIWSAFTDPWVGSISDNFRSRWGRRRPFIIIGAVLTGFCAAGLWRFPEGQSPNFYFWWLLIGYLMLATAYSVFIVPFGALGLEMTSDYHERTKLMSVRSAFNKASGLINQWLFKLIQLGLFSTMLVGARSLGLVIGVLIATLGSITGVRIKERPDLAAHKRKKISLLARIFHDQF